MCEIAPVSPGHLVLSVTVRMCDVELLQIRQDNDMLAP